ncbi:SRPBCC family protein [Arthrobacter oryzae]|uniref:SRPBCC family protein n=1 Tax=Arthrobacter oryzae TaxID=409290 RepID=UPI00273BE1EC|nr:SRPBCC family protein [Arthrobacter oryzae]WLQ07309.1 SRPBCC family protein [Arthrobacter oryzae]
MRFAVSRHIAAPAGAVWELLTDVGRWPEWGPSVRGAELDSAGFTAGSSGRVRTAAGATLPFTVTEFREGRSWSWSVAGIRATGHRVVPEDDGCRVTFTVPWWAPAYLPVCAAALRRIARITVPPVSPP